MRIGRLAAVQVHFGTECLHAEWPGAVACVGTFDGVHLGHQAVIKAAVRQGAVTKQPCVLVTFDRHPAATLAPAKAPQIIASLDENLRLIEGLGVSVAVVLAFDRALGETRAQDFFDNLLVGKLKAKSVVVGYDFAFGKGREGTPDWLRERIDTLIIPPYELDGKRVSSSAIRQAVVEGRFEDVIRWLGRPFELPGIVVPGLQLGRKLGFPTINLARSFEQVMPADGIYAGTCEVNSKSYKAAISIGFRPTVDAAHRTIEAFLLDYHGEDLYGHSVRLFLERRLRSEEKFATLDELRRQVAEDVRRVAAGI